MRPSDALYYRRILVDLCRDVDDESSTRRSADDLLSFVPDANLYYVTADMTAVARAAGSRLPIESVDSTALPSRTGFMVFDAPIGKEEFADAVVEITGIAWRTGWSVEDSDSIRAVEYSPCEAPNRVMSVDMYPLFDASTQDGPHALLPVQTEPMVWDVGDDAISNETDEATGENVLATWILMQQSITKVDDCPAERHERKRSLRTGLPVTDISVVRLRRVDGTQSDGPHADTTWSHRWLVSGHWRQQYYASEQANKPIWINPHVKGPEDRPLVVKERVTAWLR